MKSPLDLIRSFTRFQSALLSAAVGTIVVAVVLFASIMKSTSSTAAIGIFFLPFTVVPFTGLFFIFGYCLPDLVLLYSRSLSELPVLTPVRAFVAILLLFCGGVYLSYGIVLTLEVARVRMMGETELEGFLERSMLRENRFVLGALAQNSNASAAVLDRVAQMPDQDLHLKMWSVWPVMGENGKGLAVMRLIARHPNVSETTLVRLSKSSDEYVQGDVVENSKTPVSIISEYAKNPGYLIQWGLARNPKTPADILGSLASTGNEYTRSSVASNVNTPIEILIRLAKDPVWHVRRDVVANPRTPLETIESLRNDPNEYVKSAVEHLLSKQKRQKKLNES